MQVPWSAALLEPLASPSVFDELCAEAVASLNGSSNSSGGEGGGNCQDRGGCEGEGPRVLWVGAAGAFGAGAGSGDGALRGHDAVRGGVGGWRLSVQRTSYKQPAGTRQAPPCPCVSCTFDAPSRACIFLPACGALRRWPQVRLLWQGRWDAAACAHLPTTCATLGRAGAAGSPTGPGGVIGGGGGGSSPAGGGLPRGGAGAEAPGAADEFMGRGRARDLWPPKDWNMGFHAHPDVGITINRGAVTSSCRAAPVHCRVVLARCTPAPLREWCFKWGNLVGCLCVLTVWPGARIKPHFGGPGGLVSSVALTAPPNSELTVGVESRAWVSGQPLVYDGSFLHSVSNEVEDDSDNGEEELEEEEEEDGVSATSGPTSCGNHEGFLVFLSFFTYHPALLERKPYTGPSAQTQSLRPPDDVIGAARRAGEAFFETGVPLDGAELRSEL